MYICIYMVAPPQKKTYIYLGSGVLGVGSCPLSWIDCFRKPKHKPIVCRYWKATVIRQTKQTNKTNASGNWKAKTIEQTQKQNNPNNHSGTNHGGRDLGRMVREMFVLLVFVFSFFPFLILLGFYLKLAIRLARPYQQQAKFQAHSNVLVGNPAP